MTFSYIQDQIDTLRKDTEFIEKMKALANKEHKEVDEVLVIFCRWLHPVWFCFGTAYDKAMNDAPEWRGWIDKQHAEVVESGYYNR